tara:strand:- start:168 stop:437 length:270 start_codon:yes stop_codon:yes gene_type:complete
MKKLIKDFLSDKNKKDKFNLLKINLFLISNKDLNKTFEKEKVDFVNSIYFTTNLEKAKLLKKITKEDTNEDLFIFKALTFITTKLNELN